jgi:CheY-like chemotaxis protein
MKIVIVEDDPPLRALLVEFVTRRLPEASVIATDNLDAAVAAMWAGEKPAAILTDGTFPSWPNETIPFQSAWNLPKQNWIALWGWAQKLAIPLVLLSGDARVVTLARSKGMPAYIKPLETQRALDALAERALPRSLPGSPSGNPIVNGVDLDNERLDDVEPEADATGEP